MGKEKKKLLFCRSPISVGTAQKEPDLYPFLYFLHSLTQVNKQSINHENSKLKFTFPCFYSLCSTSAILLFLNYLFKFSPCYKYNPAFYVCSRCLKLIFFIFHCAIKKNLSTSALSVTDEFRLAIASDKTHSNSMRFNAKKKSENIVSHS